MCLSRLSASSPVKIFSSHRRISQFKKMSSNDRMEYWNQRWDKNQIAFHKPDVHHMLIKHFEKLCKNSTKPANIFIPLCGKTLDMKWLADQGVETVGLDGAHSALEQFYTEHNLPWDLEQLPALGPQGSLLKSKNGNIKLYCGDVMNFSMDISGTFDALWDRASLVAINREDVNRYVKIMKDLVRPGGRMLVELLEYDVSLMDDISGATKPPPPHPMFEKDLKALYEPEFTVQFLDRDGRKLQGKDITLAIFLLVKN